MDFFPRANAYLAKTLGYTLKPEAAADFRGLLKLAGQHRFVHAVRLVYMRALPVQKRHQALVQALWALLPPKTSKYRTPRVEAARTAQNALDAQLRERLANPKQ